MSGIQLSGLVNGSFDWQSVVNQLISIDSTPITNLEAQETANNSQLAAFSQLSGDFTTLQNAATALQGDGVFNGVSASSDTANSSWTATAANGTAAGNYTIDVTNLATPAYLTGQSNIADPLSATSVVSGVTMATMPTSTAVTAGTFTVDGQTVTVALTDSLQDVFDKISAATNGNVTASYNPGTDGITLASGDGSQVVLGAGNDTSNFLSVMHLANNTTDSVSSSSPLGSVAMGATLANADLKTALTGQDSSGNGAFSINGVSFTYNTGTSSLATIMSQINNSTAGVTASFDPTDDRLILTNNSTGDVGIGVSDTSGNLMGALGLTTGSTFTHGQNAQFSINGGSTTASQSNVLAAAATGITGLSVTVNTLGSQTISVSPNTDAMTTAINGFISAYNTLQSDITSLTTISTGVTGTVSTSILSGNQEVPQWATDLRNLAFNAVSGVSGAITSLDQIGIGFSGTSNQLSVLDQTQLNNALSTEPTAVGAFFQNPTTGFAAEFNSFTANILQPTTGDLAVETAGLNQENADDATKISQLQIQLDAERTNLTNEFLAMQTAQSQAESDEEIINGLSGSSSSSSSSSSGSGSTTDATATDNGTALSSSDSSSSS